MTVNLVYFVSHPIQYQAPLLRNLAGDADIELTVVFGSDFSDRSYLDTGFGVQVDWDVVLLDGYANHLLADIDVGQLIRTSDAVWVHGWQEKFLRRIIQRSSRIGKPVLMRGENWSGAMPDGFGPKGWLKRKYLARIFSQCSAYLAIGSKNRDYYIDHGIREDRIFSMPYAIDNTYFSARATELAAAEIRRVHGIAQRRKIILYAGKFIQRKHPDQVLEAWQKASWGENEKPVLMFVGDGELRGRLESVSTPDVIFTGFKNQSEMPAYYAAADLFVLLSEKEPWGLAINEAMACGVGVISSDQCAAAFDLIDDDTGLRLPAGDIDALAQAFPAALARADDWGRGARRKIDGWSFDHDIAGLKQCLAAVL